MLKLVLTVQNEELVRTDYSYVIHERQIFRASGLLMKKRYFNMNYNWTDFSGGWVMCTLYCSRKLKLNGNEVGVTRKISNVGEFYDCDGSLYKNGPFKSVTVSKNDSQCACFEKRTLAVVKGGTPEHHYNGKKENYRRF
ncbi:Hypothetical predicted protein [Paramuricea clavata]|uniref:Uncharacterized protein n=1 Tax=Paramuricea clavata TaxID=317549 RepID=A0A6S7KKC9_PARCT|nr:Hypothetical predicted protein [Paramuricea clavata]